MKNTDVVRTALLRIISSTSDPTDIARSWDLLASLPDPEPGEVSPKLVHLIKNDRRSVCGEVTVPEDGNYGEVHGYTLEAEKTTCGKCILDYIQILKSEIEHPVVHLMTERFSPTGTVCGGRGVASDRVQEAICPKCLVAEIVHLRTERSERARGVGESHTFYVEGREDAKRIVGLLNGTRSAANWSLVAEDRELVVRTLRAAFGL